MLRKKAKRSLRNLESLARIISYYFFRFYLVLTRQKIDVEPIERSLEIIQKKGLSVARFGDGEFKWMFEAREADNFEKNSSALANALLRVIQTERSGFQICIPDIFSGLHQYRQQDAVFWAGQLGHHGYQWIKTLNPKRKYLDSLITRPYMIYKDRTQGERLFKRFKQIWEGRPVILVEGAGTRFGVGNDLLKNAKNIKRIICPAKNAFEEYDRILKSVLDLIKQVNDPQILVLISLGPTATVLSNDVNLKANVQVLDIGHLDLEYSWMLMGAEKKVRLDYKYVNEVSDGDKVSKIPAKLFEQYESEIAVVVNNAV